MSRQKKCDNSFHTPISRHASEPIPFFFVCLLTRDRRAGRDDVFHSHAVDPEALELGAVLPSALARVVRHEERPLPRPPQRLDRVHFVVHDEKYPRKRWYKQQISETTKEKRNETVVILSYMYGANEPAKEKKGNRCAASCNSGSRVPNGNMKPSGFCPIRQANRAAPRT